MPPREWTDDEVKAEIREAVRIAKEDGVYKRITAIESRLAGSNNNSDPANPEGKKAGEGDPPPKGDPKDSQQNRRRGGWWPVKEEEPKNES